MRIDDYWVFFHKYSYSMHIFLILFFVLPLLIRLVAAIVSPEQLRIYESRRAKKMLRQQFGEFEENRLIKELGGRLAQASSIDAQFILSPAPLVNAGALPDGTIIVWKGLLSKTAHRPDMLAGVLAHELGHLKHDHYIRQVYWAVLIQFVLGILARPLAGVLSRNIAGRILNMGFSRFRERQADDEAVLIMKNAGFDPRGIIDLFEILSKEQGPAPFMGSHPAPLERARRIRTQLKIPEENSKEQDNQGDSDVVVIPFPIRNDR